MMPRAQGLDYQEGRIKVVDDEYLMKEVSRRVKHRLANLVKEQSTTQTSNQAPEVKFPIVFKT